jgi:hypothetical protein
MDPLADVLWHERALLETLLFRLEEAVLLSAGDCVRWWERAVRDVDEVLTTVRRTELLRAVTAGGAALDAGLRPDATLVALAAAVEQPTRSVLLDHRDAIRTLSTEIASVEQRLRDSAIEPELRRVVRRPTGAVGSPASLEAFLR